ncbi:MAG: bifunctional [glutamate--ammonia ligase]-adenylyl-L-tyrosine phosphorylase/[glutamate--ammonia-ligase] adenylyltransferase [Verrucomicrobia bacterium]|nr:bifunctional [glutamate--ammonia ligase]-adenylyl-L-tyrosine phosphorylase/[glutamate--ammonia-ligase] adenylyltransferase [Verrucomicrobiota bacterium]
MKSAASKLPAALARACKASPDPERAKLNLQRLLDAAPDRAAMLAWFHQHEWLGKLLADALGASQAISDSLARHPEFLDWLLADPHLDHERAFSSLEFDARALLELAPATAAKLAALRRFKRREMVRIGLRDLSGRASVGQTVRDLSNLADVCLQRVCDIHWRELTARHGTPAPSDFAVMGLGKLGGRELNYSSDIDLMFLCGGEGDVLRDGRRVMGNQQFFTKLAEAIVTSVGARTAEGDLFRVDLRLRPEGNAGPLVCSTEACEAYYASRGETWERMMLIKARCVAGSGELVHEFLETINPFRYPRFLNEAVIGEVAAIKQRIEREVVGDGRLTRHVKLGVGGIREIEFIVQTLQLLRAGQNPFLQTASTLEALQKFVRYGGLPESEANDLTAAYRFLRNVEHRLQMEAGLQTHTIPADRHAVLRLARTLGFESIAAFEKELAGHTGRVREIYSRLLAAPVHEGRERWQRMFEDESRQPEFVKALADAGFQRPEAAAKTLYEMARGPGYVHVSARTSELFSRILPEIVRAVNPRSIAGHQAEGGGTTIAGLAEPDEALKQLQRFIESYGSRAVLFDIFATNPKALELLLRLFDNSRFLAGMVVREPGLFEEVTRPDILRRHKTREEVLAEIKDIRNGLKPDAWLRTYKRAELLRCGVRDVLGLTNLDQVHDELSTLAEACVDFAVPACAKEMRKSRLPFAVIGMGKFGGHELGYGADLDVLFVTRGGVAQTNAAVALANRLVAFMSAATDEGTVFAMDSRLRPDGIKGVVAPALDVYAKYFARRAMLWEKQSLTKARFIAGDAKLGADFMRLVERTIYAKPLGDDGMQEIAKMRQRIETQRAEGRAQELNFKTGPGGIVEVEFLVQALQLRHGAAHRAVRRPRTLEALLALGEAGALSAEDAHHLREDYMLLRRIELVLRRLHNAPVSALPAAAAEQAALACRLGSPSLEEFWKLHRAARERVRAVWQKVFGAG